MFNSLKIKLHSAIVSRRKPSERVFVNPYADSQTGALNPKLNPYITSYDTKKTKSLQEVLIGNRIPHSLPHPELINGDMVIAPATYEPPTFAHEMKEIFIGDLMFVASKFPKRAKKEKTLNAVQIKSVCESIKW
jgi:hypothetical protein